MRVCRVEALHPAGCLDRAVEWRPTCRRPDSTVSERQRRKNNIRPKQTRLKALRCVINSQGAFCLRDMLTHRRTHLQMTHTHMHRKLNSRSFPDLHSHTHKHTPQSGEEQRSGPDGASMCLQRRELLGYSRHLFW